MADAHRMREEGRGRSAETPIQIPATGWKDILYRGKDEIAEDRVGTIAAGSTFFILLALFPALGALVSLYGLIADPVTINEHLNSLRGYVPAAVLDLVGQELARLEQTPVGRPRRRLRRRPPRRAMERQQ